MAEICPHCGNNLYLADEAPRLADENSKLSVRLRQMGAEKGSLKAEFEAFRIRVSVNQSWANRKLQRQAKEIRRLRKKLGQAVD